ncbi:MAG: S16 family serine protease [archaeon]
MSSKKSVLVTLFILIYVIGLFSGMLLLQFIPGQETNIYELLPEKRLTAEVNIVAVKQQGETGVMSKGVVEIIANDSGKTRILFNANPFVEPDTQQSIEVASKIAEAFTKKSLEGRDVIYSIEGTDAKLIGGPSAGAALAAATIAAIEGKKVREDVAITGTIEVDGRIGPIGGVIEKTAAAAENGLKEFIVPLGQSKVTYYEQQVKEEKRGFITIRRVQYVPKILDLNDYARDQNWNIEIKEVRDIGELVEAVIE